MSRYVPGASTIVVPEAKDATAACSSLSVDTSVVLGALRGWVFVRGAVAFRGCGVVCDQDAAVEIITRASTRQALNFVELSTDLFRGILLRRPAHRRQNGFNEGSPLRIIGVDYRHTHQATHIALSAIATVRRETGRVRSARPGRIGDTWISVAPQPCNPDTDPQNQPHFLHGPGRGRGFPFSRNPRFSRIPTPTGARCGTLSGGADFVPREDLVEVRRRCS